MRKIVVCDDEAYIREQLCGYLAQIEFMLDEKFTVITCANGEELLALVDDADIVLLDICMEGLSGMDAAHILRDRNQDVCLIFITSMVEYALEGYSVHAFGFLKKPIQLGSLFQQMDDALRMLNTRRGALISLKSGTETHYYNCNDIYSFEVRGHNVILVLQNETLRYFTNLSSIEKQVQTHGFFRCHQSYLVNMCHVSQVQQAQVLLDNGSAVPLSKHRRKAFLNELAKYAEELQ